MALLFVKRGWTTSPLQCYETLVDSESFTATLVTGSRWRNLQNILVEVYNLIKERQQNIVGYGIQVLLVQVGYVYYSCLEKPNDSWSSYRLTSNKDFIPSCTILVTVNFRLLLRNPNVCDTFYIFSHLFNLNYFYIAPAVKPDSFSNHVFNYKAHCGRENFIFLFPK